MSNNNNNRNKRNSPSHTSAHSQEGLSWAVEMANFVYGQESKIT